MYVILFAKVLYIIYSSEGIQNRKIHTKALVSTINIQQKMYSIKLRFQFQSKKKRKLYPA